jgi:hypothetical protein
LSLCECGCGQEVKRRFVPGHNGKLQQKVPRIKKTCEMCKNVFEVIPGKSKQKLCSNTCRNKYKSINQLTPDGSVQRTSSGYYMVKMKNHPQADKKGYIHYHRHALEQYLGYVLPKKYHVHHIDENKENNDVSNLIAIDRKAHAYLHFIMREKDERGRLK